MMLALVLFLHESHVAHVAHTRSAEAPQPKSILWLRHHPKWGSTATRAPQQEGLILLLIHRIRAVQRFVTHFHTIEFLK